MTKLYKKNIGPNTYLDEFSLIDMILALKYNT